MNINTCLTQQRSNNRFLKTRGIELDSNRPFFLVKPDPSDSINFAHIIKRPHFGLAGCNTMAGFGQDMSDAGHAIKKAAD